MCCTMCRMATRLQGRAVRRPSLPLTSADEADLAALKGSREMLDTLGQLAGLNIDLSSATESALLHAIFRAGFLGIRDAALSAGYSELASEAAADASARQAAARRRPPTWADES